MDKVFLTASEVEVKKGYLSVKGEKMAPVTNPEFVKAQLQAEWVITMAKLSKGKDFKGKEADSISDLKKEVAELLNKNKKVTYVSEPKAPKQTINDKLKGEALAFTSFLEEKSNVEEINNFLSQFEIIREFEEIGLFFDQDIVKLDKIYTMEEITKAVTLSVDLLK